ncbi:MAG: patatin family protein, partial [Rhodoferax sp.]|nr:patatin family protein [Rhodoferax sp.]
FILPEPGSGNADAFDPAWLMQPAWGEFARRALLGPGLLLAALSQRVWGHRSWARAMEQLGPVLPTGLFDNRPIDTELARLFTRAGRSNDFRRLRTRLTLVATDLDTGEAVPFGQPGWDTVPISRAVQASAALPGLFPPVEIDGRYYVDGALKKTLHASVALEQGLDLLLCLNPLVPFDASATPPQHEAEARRQGAAAPIPPMVRGGLPAVLSQTFRSLIHSRLVLGMKQYERLYPQTDILLVEPDHRDPQLYLANTFSYRQRRQVAEHAYQQTRMLLRSRSAELGPRLARHGLTLRLDRLDDTQRRLCPAPLARSSLGQAVQRLDTVLDGLGRQLRQRAGGTPGA